MVKNIYLLIIVLSALILSAYLYFSNNSKVIKTQPFIPTKVTQTTNLLFSNTKFKFQIEYPSNFILQETCGYCKNIFGDTVVANFNNENTKSLTITYNDNIFDTLYLKKYTPTGLEEILPTKITLNNKEFFYYGPGEGGVCYPDRYFYNLRGKILIFTFEGCNNDKTPPTEFKEIEKQILSSLKYL